MSLPKPNPEQQQVIDFLNTTSEHAFITGKAGTGKTHVLRWLQKVTKKKILICAPTGIAALHAGGMTVHNLFMLGTGQPMDAFSDVHHVRSKRKTLLDVDAIVIDEVSMANSDMIDSIDRTLRGVRMANEPFGGVQMIMFGDVYQLPPVVPNDAKLFFTRNKYRSEWFFDAKVWQKTDFQVFELETIHRQADDRFKELLNGVRDGSLTPYQLADLNELGLRQVDKTPDSILLGARKYIVEETNSEELKKLPGRAQTYKARINKGFGHNHPAEMEVTLKPGAHIMMLTNDRGERWVNGTRGTVTAATTDYMEVDLDGQTLGVDRAVWVPAGTDPVDFKTAPKFVQMPTKLAWAVTIHKSQGLSLKEIEVEVGSGAFSPGQTYVALSRVTTPEGLHIRTPLRMRDIMVDENVKRFFTQLRGKV